MLIRFFMSGTEENVIITSLI